MRGMASVKHRILEDDGLSLVEIMVAVTILLMAVTAMLPMLLQTTLISSQAKAQTAITNAVSSYVEEIRALPYEQIGIVGSGEPSASVDATRSAAVGGYIVLMTASINSVDDPDLAGADNYKELVIDATATSADRPPVTYRSTTYIWGTVGSTNTDVPLVSFASGSPDAGAVVSGPSVWVRGHAEAIEAGANIVRIVLKVDSEYLPSTGLSSYADFSFAENPATTDAFMWDTEARKRVEDADGLPILDSDGHEQYIYFSPDGLRLLKVEAWDSLGLSNYVTRLVLVDNYAPSPVPSITLSASNATALTASWTKAMDGTDPAAAYNVRVYKAPSTAAALTSWPYTTADFGASTTADIVATPFSRYYVQVQSESALGHVVDEDWAISNTAITRPVLSGSYRQTVTKSGGSYTISTNVYNIDVTNPQFAVNGVVTYDLWRSTSLAGLGTGAPRASGVLFDSGTTSDVISDATVYSVSSTTPTYYYLVRASFTPYGETVATELWTNVAVVPGANIASLTFSGTPKQATVLGTMGQQW